MNRYVRFLFVLPLLACLPHRADANIAPNPMTGGWPVSPYDDGATDVRMVAEDIVVRIYADSIVTTGSYSMRNEGKTVDMVVGFPFPYENDILSFRAFVDDRPVEVGEADKEHYGGSKKSVTHWKVWDMNFVEGREREIRVEYKTRPLQSEHLRMRRADYTSSLPADVRTALQQATTVAFVEYFLETGKAWKGILDRCRVSFELIGMPDANIKRYWPEDGVVTRNAVVWERTDYEPSNYVTVEYFPYMTTSQIPDVLDDILERFPRDAELASKAGDFCAGDLGRADLQRDIHHSFLAKWDEPVPQLMEYASGGRCRVNFETGEDFFAMWRMAHSLFNRYQATGDIEKGRDIAPTVSIISAAIVDSLDACGGLQGGSEWMLREARALRDLCNELTASSK